MKKKKNSFSAASRSEVVAWNRKREKMERILESLRQVESDILDIIETRKNPLLENVRVLREQMVQTCVHPKDFLQPDENDPELAECKFCGKKIRLINDSKK